MICKECREAVDVNEVVSVKVDNRTVRVCADCAHILRENEEISAQAEGAMQSMQAMLESRGRR